MIQTPIYDIEKLIFIYNITNEETFYKILSNEINFENNPLQSCIDLFYNIILYQGGYRPNLFYTLGFKEPIFGLYHIESIVTRLENYSDLQYYKIVKEIEEPLMLLIKSNPSIQLHSYLD